MRASILPEHLVLVSKLVLVLHLPPHSLNQFPCFSSPAYVSVTVSAMQRIDGTDRTVWRGRGGDCCVETKSESAMGWPGVVGAEVRDYERQIGQIGHERRVEMVAKRKDDEVSVDELEIEWCA